MRAATILLCLAAAILGWVAVWAPEPDYRPPVVDTAEQEVPVTLSGEVPSGYVVQRMEVENMCKDCCPPAVFAALSSEHAVREAAVDMQAGTAAVVVPEGYDPAPLLERLAARKYPAVLLP